MFSDREQHRNRKIISPRHSKTGLCPAKIVVHKIWTSTEEIDELGTRGRKRPKLDSLFVGECPSIKVNDDSICDERLNLSPRACGLPETLKKFGAAPVDLTDWLILVVQQESQKLLLGESAAECQLCRSATFHGLRKALDVVVMPM